MYYWPDVLWDYNDGVQGHQTGNWYTVYTFLCAVGKPEPVAGPVRPPSWDARLEGGMAYVLPYGMGLHNVSIAIYWNRNFHLTYWRGSL